MLPTILALLLGPHAAFLLLQCMKWQKAGWEPGNDAVQLEHCRIQTIKVGPKMN